MKIEKIDDSNQEDELNDDRPPAKKQRMIGIKEEIFDTRINQEISEPILQNENDVKLENGNDLTPSETVNEPNNALITAEEEILKTRNDQETREQILENESDLKIENVNNICNIYARTNQFQELEKSQLSEIFQVPKVPEVSVHDTKNLYKCLYCGENFVRRKHLKNHMTSVHEGPKPYYW